MSRSFLILIFLLPGIVIGQPLPKKLPKSIRKFTENLAHVPAGTYRMGDAGWYLPTENDTNLLFCHQVRDVSVLPFLMQKTEVSNAEYREFLNWVRDSVARVALAQQNSAFYLDKNTKQLNWEIPIDWTDSVAIRAVQYLDPEDDYDSWALNPNAYLYASKSFSKPIAVYPNQRVWTTDYRYAYNEPMVEHYLNHPAYDNYPVVGVTQLQAMAYCDWLNRTLKRLAQKHGINPDSLGLFRLPTEAEWEYAAVAGTGEPQTGNCFAWGSQSMQNAKGCFMGNGGVTYDKNHFPMKRWIDDGAFYSATVDAYAPNVFGIKNLSGNVAEWTVGRFQPDSIVTQNRDGTIMYAKSGEGLPWLKPTTEKEMLAELQQFFGLPPDTDYETHNFRIGYFSEALLHDAQAIRAAENPVIVKGGSWASPPIGLLCGARQVVSADEPHSTIGFRVVFVPAPGARPLFED